MLKQFPFLLILSLLLLSGPARAQQRNNDGFQRRNGQMHILRNGQLRPMTHDARLPTGVLVTKDGFLVAANGRRTELREGQGCDLRGNVVAVAVVPGGGLVLGAAPRAESAYEYGQDQDRQGASLLNELLGRPGKGRGHAWGKKGKGKKHKKWDD